MGSEMCIRDRADTAPAPNRSEPAQPAAQTQIYHGGQWLETPIFALTDLSADEMIAGPAILTAPTDTIVIEPGGSGALTQAGDLILTAIAQAADTQPLARPDPAQQADPVMLEIFANLSMSIAEQMGIVLRSTSQSVNVKERLDFSCAIFDASGNLVANAPHVPVHLGSMDASVKTIIASGQPIHPGDAFVQNNPHNGGSHLPDITVVSPVFDEAGENILFFTASRAHHEDCLLYTSPSPRDS